MQQERRDRAEVEAALERVKARLEPDPAESWMQRVWNAVSDFFDFDLDVDPGAVNNVFLVVAVVLFLVLLVLVARFIWFSRARSRGTGAEEGPDVAERVRELVARAREVRAQGDDTLSLRLYLFALIIGVAERGDLRYHDAWTNRELLRRGKPNKKASEFLGTLIDELEAKEFGREPTTATDLDRLERLCAEQLGTILRRAA